MNARVSLTKGVPDFASVDVTGILLRLGRKYAALALTAVLAKWPVDSGTSRAGWKVDALLQGATVRLVLTNDVPYAQHVTAKGGGPPIAPTLALDVMREAQAALNIEAEREIAEALRNAPGRRRG
jgi:hypothetical protein